MTKAHQILRLYISRVLKEAMGSTFSRTSKDPSVQRIAQINEPGNTRDVRPNDQNHLCYDDEELLDALEDAQGELTIPHRS